MICSNCGKEINERARFCTYCGKPVEQQNERVQVNQIKEQENTMTTQQPIETQEITHRNVPTTPPMNRELKGNVPSTPPMHTPPTMGTTIQGSNQKKKSIAPIIAIIAGVVVLVIAGVVGVLVLTGDKKDNTDKAKADVFTEQRELPQNVIENDKEDDKENNKEKDDENPELGQDKLAVLDYILSSANETMDKQELEELLNKLISFAEENQAGTVVTEKLGSYYEDYLGYVFAGLDNLNSLEERPAIYIQMRMDLDSAKTLSENMLNAGIDIDISAINEKEKILDDYSDRLVYCFDTTVENTISQNGVISRSVAWDIMGRCDETGLYDESDMNHPLHIRYMTALALKVDSELDSLGTEAAINRLYETIPLTDYNPLLIYYLAETYGDTQAIEWMSYINTVLPNFETYNIGEKRNFIYYYMYYDMERTQIREYMQDKF